MPSSSLMRWLDTNTVRPSSASSRRKPRIQRIPSGSSPLTGSSNTSTGGSPSMRGRDPEPLRHAEREASGALARGRGEADELEHVVDASGREAVAPREPAADGCAHAGPGCVAPASRRAPTSRERRGEVAVAAPADQDVAGVGCIEPEEHPHRRRLPCAVRPDEPGDATCADRERQVVHGDRAAVSLRQTARPRSLRSSSETVGAPGAAVVAPGSRLRRRSRR